MTLSHANLLAKLAFAIGFFIPAVDAIPTARSGDISVSGFERVTVPNAHGILFTARTRSYLIAICQGGSVMYRPTRGGSDVGLEWEGARRNPEPVEEDRLPGTINYYAGNDSAAWRIGVPVFGAVRFRDLYPGVDLIYRLQGGSLEYSFTVAPGANPNNLRMRLPEHWSALVDSSGDLKLYRAGQSWRLAKLAAFQLVDGKKIPVRARFQLHRKIATINITGEFDSSLPLIIDPAVSFSGYLGGSNWDAAYGVAADSSGNIYVTGQTNSLNFPDATGIFGSTAVFVTKMKDGVILFTTILSSSGADGGAAIAVDSGGNAYVTGTAGAANFPVTAGAAQNTFGGAQDGFVARLDPSGHILYSTFLGGSGSDTATAIAIDSSGCAYVSGYTGSTNFPVTSAVPQQHYAGGYHDAFIAKLNAAGTQLLYSTLLGGSGNDLAYGVAVDASGNAAIAGYTDSSAFPVSKAFEPQYGGGGDAFLASLNPSGTQWNFVTYLGGSETDQANAIAVDANGNIYTTGTTYSANFPVSPFAYQSVSNGGYDAFAAKVTSSGSLVYSTLFGGAATDDANAIVIDSSGQAWIAGYTSSLDLPLSNPAQALNHGDVDGFIAQLNNNGSALLFATYWGGGQDDKIWALAQGSGNIWAVGYTSSTDLPSITGGALSSPAGGYDAFAMELVTQLEVWTPSSGTGSFQTFPAVFANPNGYAQIAWGQVLFAVASNGGGQEYCLVHYDALGNGLWLYGDAGFFVGPVSPGTTSGLLQNSGCVVDTQQSTVIRSGADVQLNLAVGFKNAFSGTKNLYLRAFSLSGQDTGFVLVGTWTATPPPAASMTVTPNSGSGATQVFTASISDPPGFSGQPLGWAEVLIAAAMTGGGQPYCLIHYDRAGNGLWLYASDVGFFLGPVAPGVASNALKSSACQINTLNSAVTNSAQGLQLSVSVQFNTPMNGSKNIYLRELDALGTDTGFQSAGGWTIN